MADYIIVGAGTAGCVLARKLAEKCSGSIIIIERGSNTSKDNLVLHGSTFADFFKLTTSSKTSTTKMVSVSKYIENQSYTDYTPFFTAISQGKGLGGSSSHNYLLAVRGSPDIYDKWATISNDKRWKYENLLPIMKSLETYIPANNIIDTTQRGTNGILKITQETGITEQDLGSTIYALANALNLPIVNDYNLQQNTVGISSSQIYATISNTGELTRSYGANFLEKIVDLNGFSYKYPIQILYNSIVTRVLFNCNNVAIGVEYIDCDGNTKIVMCNKKVILCAGAIYTPMILQRSGIGPSNILNKLHIPQIVNNDHVGKHMLLQYGGIMAIQISDNSNIQQITNALGFIDQNIVGNNRDFLLLLTGAEGTNIVFPLDPILANLFQPLNGQFAFITIWNLRPKSEGSVDIVNIEPTEMPNVNINLYGDGDYNVVDSDAYKIINLYKNLYNAITNAGYNIIYPPSNTFSSDSNLFNSLLSQLESAYTITSHFSSTCKMGTDKSNGVVNGKLHVFGTCGLMIADNSVAPLPETGNTAWMAYVIGNVAANIITKENCRY